MREVKFSHFTHVAVEHSISGFDEVFEAYESLENKKVTVDGEKIDAQTTVLTGMEYRNPQDQSWGAATKDFGKSLKMYKTK